MEKDDFKTNCIIVRWTQVYDHELIDDQNGDLYFIDIKQITSGNVSI